MKEWQRSLLTPGLCYPVCKRNTNRRHHRHLQRVHSLQAAHHEVCVWAIADCCRWTLWVPVAHFQRMDHWMIHSFLVLFTFCVLCAKGWIQLPLMSTGVFHLTSVEAGPNSLWEEPLALLYSSIVWHRYSEFACGLSFCIIHSFPRSGLLDSDMDHVATGYRSWLSFSCIWSTHLPWFSYYWMTVLSMGFWFVGREFLLACITLSFPSLSLWYIQHDSTLWGLCTHFSFFLNRGNSQMHWRSDMQSCAHWTQSSEIPGTFWEVLSALNSYWLPWMLTSLSTDHEVLWCSRQR